MAEPRQPFPVRGDEGDLFRAYNHVLQHAISGAVHVSTEQTIEDACALALKTRSAQGS